jgi:general secretion pathway protein D
VISKDGRGAIVEKDDRLVITDYAENLEMIEKVLDRIDRPRPQVRITALIYDISLSDLEKLGIRWTALNYTAEDVTLGAGIGTEGATSTVGSGLVASTLPAGSNIAFGALSRHLNIAGVAHALQQAKDARLLADPNVAVLDNEQAVFQSVQEIPIQQLTETAQGGNIGTTAFKEAGITLTVTPKVAADCTISMEVSPVFSRHVGNDPAGQPIIDRREARTTLRVANRQTIVIGGLRQREDIGDFSGLPYLKDLKYVGHLFRSRDITVRESELVVFISPEIIDCADEPNGRQKVAEDTIRCRLDNIPEAEGCPPCCRRLPPEMEIIEEEPIEAPGGDPAEDASEEEYPSASDEELPPLFAGDISTAECQFGVAGRAKHVRVLVAEGRLRRLPNVSLAEDQLADGTGIPAPVFLPPVAPQSEQIRTADGSSSTSVLR